MSNKKAKYGYCLDEEDNLVCIDSINEENRHSHTFKCLQCGQAMVPKIGKIKVHHFAHAADVDCNGESYLHKLAKRRIRECFENSSEYYIQYLVSKVCNKENCNYRNPHCREEHSLYKVNIKKFYDKCDEEVEVDGFIADLLLTNSKNTSIEPTLIEICVSHPCDEKKRNSGLRIIEIKIRDERDVNNLDNNLLKESLYGYKWERNVEFISFQRNISMPLKTKIQRYIYDAKHNSIGYLSEIDCEKANNRLRSESDLELNVINKENYGKCEIITILRWLSINKGMHRCLICKFYYATRYEEYPICRLSKKYGTPTHPSMDEAIKCKYFNGGKHTLGEYLSDYFFEEVTFYTESTRPEYKVILAMSRNFRNYTLFKEKVLYYLSEKMKTHNVVILTSASAFTNVFANKLIDEIGFLKEPYRVNWAKYSYSETIEKSNEKMTSRADALIAFWDGKSLGIKSMIVHAKNNNIKVAIVEY